MWGKEFLHEENQYEILDKKYWYLTVGTCATRRLGVPDSGNSNCDP